MEGSNVLILKGAHVIDPSQAIDQVTDVTIADGKIKAIGSVMAPGNAKTLDVSNHYLTPGWIDIHVHAYGTLGFSEPDSIGIYQGVTSFVDAGGTGIGSLDEFAALLPDRLVTSLYAGPTIQPFGIVGAMDEVRSINNIPVEKWLKWAELHPGLLRYIKVGAYGIHSKGHINIGKGLAELLNLPFYVHIGEYHDQPYYPSTVQDAFRVAQAGDIITHIYHNNPGHVLDSDGKVLPFVREAEQRGVLFDIGFGGFNFSWDVAEKALAQGLRPHFISSDLQQFNVMSPCYSLANVMSVCLRLGLSLREVIEDVTSRPAGALALSDRAGSLRPELPADITVFRLEAGDFSLSDCYTRKRRADNKIVPVMAFKRGERFDCDLARAQDERNWLMQISEDEVPPAVNRFSPQQIEFLAALSKALSLAEWEPYSGQRQNLTQAYELQAIFYHVWREHPLSLRDALTATYDCFLKSPFALQIGLFLVRLERVFAIERIKLVTARRSMVAA